jgi:TolA-binding protein
MNDQNLKSIIYISKRCPYCRKLLLLLQNKPELNGSIQITCIDDEPFPKMITSVPSMISDGELWTADELFAALEGRPDTSKQMNGQQQQGQMQQQQGQMQQQQGQMQQQQGQMQQQQGQMQQQQGQQQQGQMQQGQQQQGASDPDDMLDGYFGGGGLTGGSLGFASIDDTPLSVDTGSFATLDAEDNSVDVQNDGYIQKNKKTEAFDSDYERMMSERGEVGAGGMRLGGGM